MLLKLAAKGDWVKVKFKEFGIPVFTHHAIDLGDGTYADFKNNSRTRIITKKELEFGNPKGFIKLKEPKEIITVKRPRDAKHAEEITQRAISSASNDSKYSLLRNNCEHHAYRVFHGFDKKAKSRQVFGGLTDMVLPGPLVDQTTGLVQEQLSNTPALIAAGAISAGGLAGLGYLLSRRFK